jgi:hypothetical protein
MSDNVINLQIMNPEDAEDENWNEFIDEVRDQVFKGAFFCRKKDGNYWFGCTETDKAKQIVLLHRLKGVLEMACSNAFFPDFEEAKETAVLKGLTEDEVLEEAFIRYEEEE